MENFTIFSVINMLGGLALFLYGMQVMGDGLKSGSSTAFQNAIGRVTNNPFMGFLVGLLVTAIIQSSNATIVIVAGLVGAEIITLKQSIGVIIGANVGTTATGQILRLLDVDASGANWMNLFKPATLAGIAAIIGIIFIMFLKKTKNSGTIGTIAIGFGILFTGLVTMTSSASPLSESAAFGELFTSMGDKPILGYLVGLIVSLVLQSSSASVGILQSLSMGGQLTFGSTYTILFGIFLGAAICTCIVCSIGAKENARRVGIIDISFNLIGSLIVIAIIVILRNFTGLLDNIWDAPITSGGIANANTIFKFAYALLLLPLCNVFEKCSRKIIKDKPLTSRQAAINKKIDGLDKNLFRSPALALTAAHNTISAIAAIDTVLVGDAMRSLKSFDMETFEQIDEGERETDILADRSSHYLLNLSNYIEKNTRKNDQLNIYMKSVSEFERIGDLALNITQSAKELDQKGFAFSEKAIKEIEILDEVLVEVMSYTNEAFETNSAEAARHIEPIEEVIDDVVGVLRENHLTRLREGKCNVDAGFAFLDMLVNVERISDQCSNMGVYVLALNDPEIAGNQHDYLRQLHRGEDEQFNTEYSDKKKYYYDKLISIGEII